MLPREKGKTALSTASQTAILIVAATAIGVSGYVLTSAPIVNDTKQSDYCIRYDLNTRELMIEREKFISECKNRDYDEYMLEYIRALTFATNLEHKKDTTQADIDKAVEDIRAAREYAIAYHEPEDTIQTDDMTYNDLCQSLQKGKRYHLNGYITNFAGTMNSDRHITIRWHFSDSKNECCNIIIPDKFYNPNEDPRKASGFTGNGIFEGFDRSNPVFTCTNRFELTVLN